MGAGAGAGGGVAEPLFVRCRRGVERFEQRRALAALAAPALGHGDARATRQHLDRLEESHLLGLHDELEYVAPGLAAEAVVELPFGAHRERRGLLLVERAAAHEVPSHAPERHGLRDDLDEVTGGANALDPGIG